MAKKKTQRKSKGQARRPSASSQMVLPEIPWQRVWWHVSRASAVLVLAALLWWGHARLTDPQVLPLGVVSVKGEFRYLDRQKLQQVVSGVLRGNWLTLDVDSIQQAVLQRPWVASASVRRSWPDVVEVNVREHQPRYRWNKTAVLSADGYRFRPRNMDDLAALPALDGPDNRVQEVFAEARNVQQLLLARGLQLESLSLDQRGSWKLKLQDGLELALGKEQRQSRLARFLRILPQLNAGSGQPVIRADLRYANGVSVLRRAAS